MDAGARGGMTASAARLVLQEGRGELMVRGGVGSVEGLVAWARRMPEVRSSSLDAACEKRRLRGDSLVKRVLRPVACFFLPFMRHWGPFL